MFTPFDAMMAIRDLDAGRFAGLRFAGAAQDGEQITQLQVLYQADEWPHEYAFYVSSRQELYTLANAIECAQRVGERIADKRAKAEQSANRVE